MLTFVSQNFSPSQKFAITGCTIKYKIKYYLLLTFTHTSCHKNLNLDGTLNQPRKNSRWEVSVGGGSAHSRWEVAVGACVSAYSRLPRT